MTLQTPNPTTAANAGGARTQPIPRETTPAGRLMTRQAVAGLAGSLIGLLLMAAPSARAQSPSAAPGVEPVVVHATAHFAFDDTTLPDAEARRLLAEVGRMQGVTWQQVTATGHADSVGTVDYNADLGQRRAAAVRRYLVSQGVARDAVALASRGEGDPVADNGTAAGRAQNRRTEVVFRGVRSRDGMPR